MGKFNLLESFQLVADNVATDAVTAYGGEYVFSQLASDYGTITLEILGPDQLTWQPLVVKTESDGTDGATGLKLGAYAQLRVALDGTTGAAASLTRIP